MLDKKALLDLVAPRVIEKTVVGLGEVCLRELSAPEVSEIRESCKTPEKKADFGYHLVIASVVDTEGKPMFVADDLPALRAGAQSRIGELVSAVMEANGFHVREDAEKN